MSTQNVNGAETKSSADEGGSKKGVFYNMALFIFNISGLFLFAIIGLIYLGGVARVMEQRFSLSSSQTGVLFSCENISSIIVVLFIGYLARRGHKPRIISITMTFTGVALLLMSLPHFVFDSTPVGLPSAASEKTGINISSVARVSTQFCSASTFDSDNMCNATFSLKNENNSSAVVEGYIHPAYYIFVISKLIGGVGTAGMAALGFSYIDENSPKTKTSLYMGIITSTFQFGPVLGYMLSAFTLRLPENLLTSSSVKPDDPTFIGCWWLGYLICGVAILSLAIPMWFFPKRMSSSPAPDEEKKAVKPEKLEEEQKQSVGILEKIKEFLRCLVRLFRNKMYMIMLGCSLAFSYIFMGINMNMVRYIMIHFFERAFVGSLIASIVLSLSSAIGTFTSGFIMTKYQLGLVGGIRMMILAAVGCAVGLFTMFFIRCPQLEMAGDINPTSLTLNVLNECNRHCKCPSDWTSYAPVCGSDKITYFSSCFAGCDDFINGTFVSCGCVGNNTNRFTKPRSGLASRPESHETAQHGVCIPECNGLIPFAIVAFVTFCIGAFSVVPTTIVFLRSVNDIDRPFALAFSKFFLDIFGYMPAPILFGLMIDSSCRLWQRTAAIPSSTWFKGCSPPDFNIDDTGSCLLYDTAKVRHLLFGSTFGFKICELILLIILNVVVVKRMNSGKIGQNGEVAVDTNGNGAHAGDGDKEESLQLKKIDRASDDEDN